MAIAASALKVMAGTVRSLEQTPLKAEDAGVWEEHFSLLVDQLSKLNDPELGANLRAAKWFYDAAVQVAKGYFDKPFGGLTSASGQFGFRLIMPQDLRDGASGSKIRYYWSWRRTVTPTAGAYTSAYILGNASTAAAHDGPIYACDSSENKSVIAFHSLISYTPDPRLIALDFNVNDVPYTPYSVEPITKINKENKLFKLFPMVANILLHPGGHCYVRGWFDLLTGTTDPSGSNPIDIEIAPWGLVFGEYDFLKSGSLA